MFLQRNVAGQVFVVPGSLRAIADGSAVTAGTITIVKDGAAAAGAGTLTHISGGAFKYAPTAGETDCKIMGYVLEGTGAITLAGSVRTTNADPNDANALGLGRLDAAVSTRSTYAGADTAGTTTLLGRIPGAVALAGTPPSWYASAPVAATGKVKASPTPTRTTFTLTDVAGSPHAARKTLFINAMSGEGVRVASITPSGGEWAVVLAGTGLEAAPAADDLAFILGQPATSAADDTPGVATLVSRVTGNVALAMVAPSWYTAPSNPTDYARDNAAPSWYTAFNPATTGVMLRADAFDALPKVDGVSFLGQHRAIYSGMVGQLSVPAAGTAGTATLKTPGGTLVATIPVDGAGNRTGPITIV